MASFSPAMLITDTRFRAYTFQFIALIVLICLMALIGWNLVQNLATAGLEISYEFLGEPANYDINQRLLDYNSQDTHMRASIIGILNTLLVAIMGCITATIIGVVVGILRLSNNWIISKMMAVYVEIFRNVPVLIWIFMINGIFIAVWPHMRAYYGEDPTHSFIFFDSIAYAKQGIWIPEVIFNNGFGDIPFFEGTWRFEISIDLMVILAVLAISWFAVRMNKRRAKAVQDKTGKTPNTTVATLFIWAVPMLALLWYLGFELTGPDLTGRRLKPIDGGTWLRGSLVSLWIALSLYTAAFIAENVRAGILAISKGQTEAAASLGLRPGRIMSLVILPQALRVIIPPLISHYLNLTKNSSLAIAVGYMDITGTLGGITQNQTGRAIETVLLMMLFYLIISLSISAIMNVYNNAVKLKER